MLLMLKQRLELVDRQPRLANDCSQRALGELGMVRDRDPGMRLDLKAGYDVAAALMIRLIPYLAKCFDCFPTRNQRHMTHT